MKMPEEEDKTPSINPGYPLAQLLKAITGAGKDNAKRIKQWQQVLAGLFDGSLSFGSRTPVANAPAWVTLEVAHGGFATGNLAASGPLAPHELEKLAKLKQSSQEVQVQSPITEDATVRSALNLYYLSEMGQPELMSMITSGCYRVYVPEEAALLLAAWLTNQNEDERSAKLVETILPFFDKLRFYPVPHGRPARVGAGIYLQTAGETVVQLRSKRPQKSVQRMRESIQVWTPLYDRIVALFLETVEGALPYFETDSNQQLLRGPKGQPIVSGGWPCRQFSEDWTARCHELLSDYDTACSVNTLCKKHRGRRENFARLREYLKKIVNTSESLTSSDVGMIRKILASYVSKHGAPGSDRLCRVRSAQKSV
jgi:hypothetical protein